MKVLNLDLRQLCYLEVLVSGDVKKCTHCKSSRCGLSKEQCESYKRVKREVLELLENL